MFTIRAAYSDKVEVKSSRQKITEFFADIKNFVELMPGIESIHTDGKGITHWRIRADIPFIGEMKQSFTVELSEKSDERIEWSPIAGEKQNLLRYAVDFVEKGANLTLIQFSQTVELRRNSARELHLLAGLAGESIISSEMSKRVAEMIKVFVRRARERLESAS
ncbi:MAG: SRPBCC domain-containing protein [Acidobacteriota bacterium]|nr:SRPBCC domain-containing protein [Acidobacteriota bacterium]